mmetsp:Transcript_1729/g.3695  ORF Transcript_1729/g.3695 Transcript_1729/m.3695 type:complete len:257 (+) Transcript_1729:10-780(+)
MVNKNSRNPRTQRYRMTMKPILAAVPLLYCMLNTSAAFHTTEIHRKAPTRTFARTHSSIGIGPVPVENGISESEGNANDSRRAFLATALAFTFAKPTVSNAVYGEDAKILIPDVVQNMADRNTKQCLVESLGTRECLVYLDPDNQLYKGSDADLLFERLGSSFAALKDVPTYIENKQWSKILCTLTGPMGTLSSTMNELIKNVDENEVIKILSVDIRKDLYAIAAAAERKNGNEAYNAYEKAEKKLDKFVTLVSSM